MLRTTLLYIILIGIAITSVTVGAVYAALSQSAGAGTNVKGETTLYALKINPSVDNTATAHIKIQFPTGFTLSAPRVFSVQNIGSGHLSQIANPPTISYDVDTPAIISAGKQVVILVSGIVNPNTAGSGQILNFTTLDSGNNVIESGTFPLSIVNPTPDITDTGGKVVINNTTPQKTLDVKGDIQLSGNIYSSSGTNGIKIIPGSGGDVCIGSGC